MPNLTNVILEMSYPRIHNRTRYIYIKVLFGQIRNLSTEKLSNLRESYVRLDKIKDLRQQLTEQFKLKGYILDNTREPITQKLNRKGTEINNWYIKKIGLDQVKIFQDRVIIMQAELSKAQELRRDYDTQLKEKRIHLNKIQEQINKINRYQDSSSGMKYMELIQEEMREIGLEKELNIKFDEADKKERELFTSFCIAIRDSHDKERTQAEYTKYFGIILSIIGTIVGSILTLIINSVRTRDLLSGIEEVVDNQMQIKDEKLDKLDIHVKSLDSHIKNLMQKITEYQNKNKDNSENNKLLVTKEEEQRSSGYFVTSKQAVTGAVVAGSYFILKLFGF